MKRFAVLLILLMPVCGIGCIQGKKPVAAIEATGPLLALLNDTATLIDKGLFTSTNHLGKSLDDTVRLFAIPTTPAYEAFRKTMDTNKHLDRPADKALRDSIAAQLRGIK